MSTRNDLAVIRITQSAQRYVSHPDVIVSDISLLESHFFGLYSVASAFSVSYITLIQTKESKGYVPARTSLL